MKTLLTTLVLLATLLPQLSLAAPKQDTIVISAEPVRALIDEVEEMRIKMYDKNGKLFASQILGDGFSRTYKISKNAGLQVSIEINRFNIFGIEKRFRSAYLNLESGKSETWDNVGFRIPGYRTNNEPDARGYVEDGYAPAIYFSIVRK